MKNLDSFVVYEMFLAIKQTFNPINNYNYFRYGGKLKTSRESYLNRKDKKLFHKLNVTMKGDTEKIRNYLFMCMLYEPNQGIAGCLSVENQSRYVRFFDMYTEDFMGTFRTHLGPFLDTLNQEELSLAESMSTKSGLIPFLMNELQAGQVSPVLVCLFEKAFGVIRVWNNSIDVFRPFSDEMVKRLDVFRELVEIYAGGLTKKDVTSIMVEMVKEKGYYESIIRRKK